MNLTFQSRRSYVGCFALVVAGVAAGCSQRDEWRNYYIDPPAAPSPRPSTPNPAQPGLTADAAASSADVRTGEVTRSVDSGLVSSPFSDSSEPDLDAGNSGTAVTDVETNATADATADAAPDAQTPFAEGAPLVNAALADLGLDVFGTFDNRFWFVVSDEQVNAMNEGRYGGGGNYGDIYAPNGGSGGKTYVDHLLVTSAAGLTADAGKVQATLVGGSTYRPWTESTLPNIKVDSNEFQAKARLGGYEHLRFNNAVVGSIFREKFAYDFYRALGYPAPNAGYAWVSSTVWSPEVAVPYVVVESYKRQFCRDRDEYFGGECPNMWEFASDITWGEVFSQPDNCQYSDCDATLASEMSSLVAQTPEGPGFKAATATYIDWDSFHEFQCLSWLFGTWDDYVHGGNNTVLVERPDGKFQFLPYSVDISFSHDWGAAPPLPGGTALPRGCQSDPECWEDTIATCQVMIDAYAAADPVARLDALYADLDDAGMLRQGDDGRYEQMRSGIQTQLLGLNDELVYWRDNPDPYGNYYGGCAFPLVECGGSCIFIDDCPVCDDQPAPGPEPVPMPEPLPGGWLLLQAGDGGASDAGAFVTGSEGPVVTAPDVTGSTDAWLVSLDAAVPAASSDVASAATSAVAVADAGIVPSPAEAGTSSGYDATWGQVTSDEEQTTGGQPCRPFINYYLVR